MGVASSRAEARGLERASEADIETAVFSLADEPDRAERDEALAGWLEERGVELVVLAGFMELLTPGFIRRFAGRIVNVHPALLPAFPGLGAIEQALELRREGRRRDGPLRRRGRRQRADRLAGSVRASLPRDIAAIEAADSTRSSTPAAARGAADRRGSRVARPATIRGRCIDGVRWLRRRPRRRGRPRRARCGSSARC